MGTRLGAAAGLVLAAGLVAGFGAPAEAGPSDGACDQSEWCIYKDAGFQGCRTDVAYFDQSDGGNLDNDYVGCKGQKMKDSVSSYQNRTKGWLVMWEHPGRKGFEYCVVPGGSGDVERSFNDKASSAFVVTTDDFGTIGGEGKCNFIDRN